MTSSFIIEGIDRLGKSTLIENIQHALGYFQVIHYQKPKVLDFYKNKQEDDVRMLYQRASFNTMFRILGSHAPVILDRAHLGEMVYAPIYRNYSGAYVFDLEKIHGADKMNHVRMILLTEDFETSKHFVDDGESFDPSKRQDEQKRFIDAFNQSQLPNKRIICVTDPNSGEFKSKELILAEALKE